MRRSFVTVLVTELLSKKVSLHGRAKFTTRYRLALDSPRQTGKLSGKCN